MALVTDRNTHEPATVMSPPVAETGPASPAQGPVSPGALAQSARRHASVPGSPSRSALAGTMSEATLERHMRAIIKDLEKTAGVQILHFHPFDSRRSTSGWPDWSLLGPRGLIFRELKRERGPLTRAQREWLAALKHAGQDADVWRPSDLLSGRIGRELAALAGLKGAA